MNENTTTANEIEFPQAYYDAAGSVNDVKQALNTAFGGYSTYFFTTDPLEAKDSIEELRKLINLREFQIELARRSLAVYEAEVKRNGPRKYGEFQAECYRRRDENNAA
jgi:hypothetical protein